MALTRHPYTSMICFRARAINWSKQPAKHNGRHYLNQILNIRAAYAAADAMANYTGIYIDPFAKKEVQ